MSTQYIYSYQLYPTKNHLEISFKSGCSNVFTLDGKRAIKEGSIKVEWKEVLNILDGMEWEVERGVTKFRSFNKCKKEILKLLKDRGM